MRASSVEFHSSSVNRVVPPRATRSASRPRASTNARARVPRVVVFDSIERARSVGVCGARNGKDTAIEKTSDPRAGVVDSDRARARSRGRRALGGASSGSFFSIAGDDDGFQLNSRRSGERGDDEDDEEGEDDGDRAGGRVAVSARAGGVATGEPAEFFTAVKRTPALGVHL